MTDETINKQVCADRVVAANRLRNMQQTSILMAVLLLSSAIVGLAGLGTFLV